MTFDIDTTRLSQPTTALRPPVDLMALHQKWQKLSPMVVKLEGQLDEEGLESFLQLLHKYRFFAEPGHDVLMAINSPGGISSYVQAVSCLKSAAEENGGALYTVAAGSANSAGSLALVKGSYRIVSSLSSIMVHGPGVPLKIQSGVFGPVPAIVAEQTIAFHKPYSANDRFWKRAFARARLYGVELSGIAGRNAPVVVQARQHVAACREEMLFIYQKECGGAREEWEKRLRDFHNPLFISPTEAKKLGMVDVVGIPCFVADILEKHGFDVGACAQRDLAQETFLKNLWEKC